MDEAGFLETTICLSNGLDERTIKSLRMQEAVIDSIGAGDNIAASKERVGGVYKLVAVEKDGKIIPKIKVSNDTIKTINPGYKRVYRFYDQKTGYALGDVIALHDEIIPLDRYTLIKPGEEWKTTTISNYTVRELQVPIIKDGEIVYDMPSVRERQEYCHQEFKTIYPEIKRTENPHEYYVDLSKRLLTLKKEKIMQSVSQVKVRKRAR